MAKFEFDIPEKRFLSWITSHILREYFEEPDEDDEDDEELGGEADGDDDPRPIDFGEESSLPGGPRLVHAIRRQINDYIAARVDRMLGDKLTEKIDAMVTGAVEAVLRDGFATYTAWGTKNEVKSIEMVVREALFEKDTSRGSSRIARVVEERMKTLVDAEIKIIVAGEREKVRAAMAEAASKAIVAAAAR